MNKSLYIKQIEKDTNELWFETLGSGGEKSHKRAFCDKTEAEFWDGYSKKYDTIPSLYDYWPEIFDKLVEIIGKDKEVIEFGPGTGKFTIPMTNKQAHVTAIDFSKDMLDQLQKKAAGIQNLQLVHGKIEMVSGYKADVVYSINAIYRIQDMKNAIKKMQKMAREKVVIVWTMQRSPYDAILNQTEVKGIERRQEYIHILNILYDLGIDGNLEMVDVYKDVEIKDIHENYKELAKIASEYQLDSGFLFAAFDQSSYKVEERTYFRCPLKVAFIHFDGE